MRIAFFTDTYIPNTDGVVTCIQNYRRELEQRGHEVFIFSPGTKKQKKENTDSHVHYFTSASFRPYPDYRIALFNFFSPVKLVKERNIDIVHSHGIATTGLAAMRAAQKLRLPSLASFHTLVPEAMHYITSREQLQGFLQNVAWKYLRWYYGHFQKVLVPSNYTKRIVEGHGITNCEMLVNGVDRSVFHGGAVPKLARKEFGLKASEPLVLHVGRVAKEKNLEALVETAPSVLNILPETKFLIVGKGPAEGYYQDLVRKKALEGNFIFTGPVSQEVLASVYGAADALAFPSRFDTQGLVVLEAMASGTPPVVHRDSAAAEFVEDEQTGYKFSDNFDFHEKLLRAIRNKKKMRPAILQAAEQMDNRKTVDRLLEIYEGMMRE